MEAQGISISPQAIELISKMLEFNPDNRYAMADLKEHPWVQSEVPNATEVHVYMNSLKSVSDQLDKAPKKVPIKKESTLLDQQLDEISMDFDDDLNRSGSFSS